MHDIEPYYQWRDLYIASEDHQSPFHGRVYSEFTFTQKIYNYYIHPQWDDFGSSTLYVKILYVDYPDGFAILEFIGEWNDCLHNDVMILKQRVIDPLMEAGIFKFILIGENVLNFHGEDDCYYQEWHEEVTEHDGWICFLNILQHIETEMVETQLHHFITFGDLLNTINWRPLKPRALFMAIENIMSNRMRHVWY